MIGYGRPRRQQCQMDDVDKGVRYSSTTEIMVPPTIYSFIDACPPMFREGSDGSAI
ncbi:hypothetical protein DPMN_081789 [Dreissena polymorpha]|uniref:Uncharacterized protein n=1 Tax=Dreissena polymorpha TaxID=45954 RepID=A0A9D3Y5J4_DREPO|nr:hypothetical protein DPMN_081713 [Dreissena polymorpha]KAH3694349.1 hypothetical protein DPMN_081789 [Dreissena polymorpha]